MSSADIAAGIGASFVWVAACFVRLGALRSPAGLVVASCCASSLAVPTVAVVRYLGSSETAAGRIVLPAMLALLPVATFGSLIQTHTHHRALGAVTFAVGAAFVTAIAFLVAERVRRRAATGSAVWRLLRYVLFAACGASVAWIAWVLVGPGSPPGVRAGAVDAALGIAVTAVFCRIPRASIPSAVCRAAPGAFAALAAGGIFVAWKNAASFAALCADAPVTLGIFGLLGCR
jgi:hypothetical protein